MDLARHSRFDLSRPWSVKQVEDSIIAAAQEDLNQIEFSSPEDHFIRGPLSRTLLLVGDPQFLISRAAGFDNVIEDLLYRRVIHEAPRQVGRVGSRNVDSFVLDYGLWLEIVRALPISERPAVESEVPPDDARRLVQSEG